MVPVRGPMTAGQKREGEGLPFVTERRERENSAGGGRTGAMDLVGGTSSNPGMPRRVRTPNPPILTITG